MRVAVGLSGGFDSFMTCYLLKMEGYDVFGVTMRIWDGELSFSPKKNACYGPDENEDIEYAKKASEILSIPHFVVDLRKEYKESVLSYFVNEYARGRTPNPCVVCNSKIKFGLLLEKIKELGISFDYFATGHYARIEYDKESKRYLLKRGFDNKKDQSYFLYRLTQSQLKNILFPLGRYKKRELKEIALSCGFREFAQRPESQDFFAGDYSVLLSECKKPGNIVDLEGRVIGKHTGIGNYTIGQRRHLNLPGLKEPFYVLKIDAERNEIVAGPKRYLFGRSLYAKNVNWLVPEEEIRDKVVLAQIRYRSQPAQCIIRPEKEGVFVEFLVPQEGITPGQSVVFYDEDVVLGGGIIDSTHMD